MNNLILALEITALGMGLVFAAILLLWWMMTLLTHITAEKATSPSIPDNAFKSDSSASAADRDRKAQAAAITVAIALAELEDLHRPPLPMTPTAIVSAWQLGMRTKQLYQKGMPVHPPRKAG